MNQDYLRPLTLSGRVVRLEPLREDHVLDLVAAGQDESIWRFMPYGANRTVAQMVSLVHSLLDLQNKGTDLPFATVDQKTGKAVGMTRLMDIQPANRGLEIGGTWLAVPFQRTAANTECKYLLLTYAFETLQCLRVQLKTDLRNERSQRAIERLGAQREGVLRNNLILPDGYVRSSVYFSILDLEWPAVKTRLEGLLARPVGKDLP